MLRRHRWKGGLQLATRATGSLARIGIDAAGEAFGASLPRTPEQIARPEVINDLVRRYAPPGAEPLPHVRAVQLPGVEFESSNCRNFLVELEFEDPEAREGLPGTAYVKLPCDELMTRSFANTLGFWALECTFCERVAQHIPIRVPRVYAAAQRGARFVLLLENLREIPGVELFVNRDMAAGTSPERAARVLRSFARMHAEFWGWSERDREKLLPIELNTFLAPKSRELTRALNASAIGPAMRAAPDLLSRRIGETVRRAIEEWDTLLDAWYEGPLTLVHGDSHLGNCFEYPTSEGLRVGLIDFQATHWSKGMRDVQYFLINSLETDVLEANETELIGGYCDELASRGVALSRRDAFDQYRAFSFQTLMVGVVPLGLGSLTERDATVRAITRRSAAAVERLGFREWLEALR
ncbi:MAG: phosphotransferase [Myxococcota bacterium]|nr:phosphotransferase [Myxococcota bacterium]